MLKYRLLLALLLIACFSLATFLQPRLAFAPGDTGPQSFLGALLGDGRTLIASELFTRADVYFHRGNYPSMFEINAEHENHMANEANGEDADEHVVAPGAPHDWLERFGRRFYPVEHVHLQGTEAREMLPWLKLSAELNPQNIETYTVAAYWLRRGLGRPKEAEQFLREGLAANPNDMELMFELGRVFASEYRDPSRARNIWRAAERRWHELDEAKAKPGSFVLEEILGGLAKVDLDEGRREEALVYLEQMKGLSPRPDLVQARIDEIRRGVPNGTMPVK